MRDCFLPFAAPARSSWRLRGSEPQFPSQKNQIVCDVDVVERFRKASGEFKGPRARQQSVERAPGSHSISFKERRVSGLGANQIVASIMSWPDHHVMRDEYFKCVLQNGRSEVWTITVERNDMLVSGGSEVSKNRSKSCGETFAFLRYDLHGISY